MKYIFMLLIILLGALDIWSALTSFMDGQYFRCGLNAMLAIWMIALLVKAVDM